MEIKEEGKVVDEKPDEELTLEQKLESQLNSIIASKDQVAVILCPPESLKDVEDVIVALKEKSPGYKLVLDQVPINSEPQEGLEEPVMIGLSHLTASFLSERFRAFLEWMQGEYAASMGMNSIPIIPMVPELRFLFLLDSWLVWRSKESMKKPDIWSPSKSPTL